MWRGLPQRRRQQKQDVIQQIIYFLIQSAIVVTTEQRAPPSGQYVSKWRRAGKIPFPCLIRVEEPCECFGNSSHVWPENKRQGACGVVTGCGRGLFSRRTQLDHTLIHTHTHIHAETFILYTDVTVEMKQTLLKHPLLHPLIALSSKNDICLILYLCFSVHFFQELKASSSLKFPF